MRDLTPEERVRRVKAALAEAGYPDAEVSWRERGIKGLPSPTTPWYYPPLGPWWRACMVAGEPNLPCWPCFEHSPLMTCDHDPLTSPWPEVVR